MKNIITLLLVFSTISFSQDFWEPTNGPYGGNIFTVVFDPNVPNVIYAGGKGGVFKSTDNGASWNKLGDFLRGSKLATSIVDLLIPSSKDMLISYV